MLASYLRQKLPVTRSSPFALCKLIQMLIYIFVFYVANSYRKIFQRLLLVCNWSLLDYSISSYLVSISIYSGLIYCAKVVFDTNYKK